MTEEPPGGRPANLRLRGLYLTHHAPWPTFSGGRIREAQLVPRLTDVADIELVAVTRTLSADMR